MKNWTIGGHHTIGFAVILVLFATVAAASYVLLKEVRNQQQLIATNILPGLEIALSIKVNASAIQMQVFQHLLARSDDQKSEIEEKIHAYSVSNAKSVSNYDRIIISAEDRELYEQVKAARQTYATLRVPMLALSRDGKLFEALQANIASVQPARDAYEKKCDEFVNLKKKQAATANNACEKAASLASAVVVGAAFLAVVLGAFIATLIVRGLGKTLSRLASQLDDGSNEVASASAQVSAASQTLAEGASEQASSLEETSASLEEISSMTNRNAQGAESAKALSSQTRAAADAGASDMLEMSKAMADVKAASDNISKISRPLMKSPSKPIFWP